jgi:hypothetical protein
MSDCTGNGERIAPDASVWESREEQGTAEHRAGPETAYVLPPPRRLPNRSLQHWLDLCA